MSSKQISAQANPVRRVPGEDSRARRSPATTADPDRSTAASATELRLRGLESAVAELRKDFAALVQDLDISRALAENESVELPAKAPAVSTGSQDTTIHVERCVSEDEDPGRERYHLLDAGGFVAPFREVDGELRAELAGRINAFAEQLRAELHSEVSCRITTTENRLASAEASLASEVSRLSEEFACRSSWPQPRVATLEADMMRIGPLVDSLVERSNQMSKNALGQLSRDFLDTSSLNKSPDSTPGVPGDVHSYGSCKLASENYLHLTDAIARDREARTSQRRADIEEPSAMRGWFAEFGGSPLVLDDSQLDTSRRAVSRLVSHSSSEGEDFTETARKPLQSPSTVVKDLHSPSLDQREIRSASTDDGLSTSRRSRMGATPTRTQDISRIPKPPVVTKAPFSPKLAQRESRSVSTDDGLSASRRSTTVGTTPRRPQAKQAAQKSKEYSTRSSLGKGDSEGSPVLGRREIAPKPPSGFVVSTTPLSYQAHVRGGSPSSVTIPVRSQGRSISPALKMPLSHRACARDNACERMGSIHAVVFS